MFYQGYIKRQAIYACLTCCSDARTDPSKRAGVCLACSLSCHENHEMVELYTKRNFRCDCGNPKFDSNPCQFTPEKSELNEDNRYNQNFSGVYCICSRPYPDPESTVEDEMIQCIICEDWLHASHLESKLPLNDQYAEMICKGCMDKNEFLHDYSILAVNALENECVDIDDSIIKDSAINGEAEVKVNGLMESPNEEAEKSVKDDKDAAKAEEKEFQSEEKVGDLETAQEKEIANEKENTDKVVTESSVAETPNLDAPSDKKINTENKHNDTTPDQSMITENDASEAGAGTVDTDKNVKNIEEAPVEASTEDKPQEPEETEKLEDNKLEPTPADNSTEKESEPMAEAADNSKEKVENVKFGDQPSAEQETDETANMADVTTTTTSDAPPHVENKEDTDPVADDDNKEIEAIDKLLAEGTNEVKSEIDQAPEKKETNMETASDTIINPDEGTKENEEKVVTTINQNTEVEPSKEVDGAVTDVKMNQDSTDKEVISDSTPMTNGSSEVNDNKRKLSTNDLEELQDNKKPKLVNALCSRPRGKKIFEGATFWPSHFRQKLCTCSECITMYKDLSVLFLTDLEDTVKAYEDLGKARNNGTASTQYEKGLEALSSLDRTQQINALTEYNKMKDKLLDFLKSFKEKKEIVKEEDIKAFFAQMKPKREPDGVYFCR